MATFASVFTRPDHSKNKVIILSGPTITLHCTTGRDPRQKPRRFVLFPSRIVLPLLLHLRCSRLRPRHHPTSTDEFGNIDMPMEPDLFISIP
ncbi:hypothetical protein CCACVL1_27073 [Corchorus capsularis]|uniref:Uncharacterized protein n=1 Tax=Corchorus capsularis TaxID=210143 RepID=A0A1R3GCB0_COCAP|nr:hypothetical protein CCACVL1_27073 [Corchorus capsularis]